MSEKIPTVEIKDEPKEVRYTNLYESTGRVYTRKVSGFFQSVRRYTGLPLIVGFLLLPWLTIDSRPAILFDLPERQFHILWMTFWPQDGMFLAWLLIIAAFALFTVTVLVGRVWCGFTCPQTVWTLMFIWAEHFCEGDRNKMIKLDKQGWSAEKVLRKGSKHTLWLLISFITGITFVGYFTPIGELLLGFWPAVDSTGFVTFEISSTAAFWTFFFMGMTYLNAGWLREEVCKYMCPYARFQSVMYDQDTLAVHYDATRGESRGARKAGDDYKAEGKGDCIDCSWCVQVCPVDIDIRDGLQYECINCGLCIDACNQVMEKMDYEPGLIRFTSEDALQNGTTHFIRPRLFGYALVLILMISAFAYKVAVREPLSVDVIRDRGVRMYRVSGGYVQNVYTVKINNMDRRAHTYNIAVEGDLDFKIGGYRAMELEEGEVFTFPIRIAVPKSQLEETKMKVNIIVTSNDDSDVIANQMTTFIGPAQK